MRVDATLAQGVFRLRLRLQVGVGYSSTCPCSAALSRQLIEQGFAQAFAGQASLDPARPIFRMDEGWRQA